jgi:hypothetical protein
MYRVCDFMKILLKFLNFSLSNVFFQFLLHASIYTRDEGEKQQLDDKSITRKFYF